MTGTPIRVELPGDHLYDECYATTFTLGDAEALSIVQKTGDTKQLYEVIDKRLNLSVYELTLQDLWYLLHWQRINSYPKYPLSIPWDCPNCEHSNRHELRGSNLDIKDIDPDYEHGVTVDFPSAGELQVRLPLVGDENTAKAYLRKLRIKDADPALYKQILIACTLEPSGGTLDDRVKLVDSMDADDHIVYKGFEQLLDYGVQRAAKFTCDNCKEESKVKFRFDLTTFFPRVSHTDDIRSRILLRKAPANNEDTGGGSREADLHAGDAHEESEGTETEARPSKGTNRGQKKVKGPSDDTKVKKAGDVVGDR